MCSFGAWLKLHSGVAWRAEFGGRFSQMLRRAAGFANHGESLTFIDSRDGMIATLVPT
jgi:hypothetical protein